MIGRTFSHYRIVSRLGAGGMGEVFKAEDLELSRPVALKFLSREMTLNKTFARRFMREAQAASALDHPNVCTIYEIKETTDGRMFIAMAYYEGKTLQARIAEGPLALEEALAYALGVADGLDQAHQRGIVHRDIKPGNVMTTADGVVKILDFGLAKLTGRSKVTTSSKTIGTLAYMSPEQTQGKPVDHRTDIFSLGVMLYEMVTGENPFLADNQAAVIYKIMNVDPRAMRTTRPGVPARLEEVVSKAIAKNTAVRYESMGEFRDDLFELLRKVSPSRALRFEALRRRAARRAGKNARLALVCALVAAVAVAAAARRDDIRDLLGLGGLGDAPGVVVMPFETKTADARTALLAAGLTAELSGRIERLAALDGDRRVWVVPHDRVAKAAVSEPSRARAVFGADAVVTGVADGGPGGLAFEMTVSNARTMRRLGSFRVTTASDTWRRELHQGMARALELHIDAGRLEAAAGGERESAEAYEGLVLGLGYMKTAKEGAADSALAAFDDAIAMDSTFASAYVERAGALFEKYVATGESRCADEALESCARALRLDSLRSDAHVLCGRIRARAGDDDQAVAAFARALAANPRDIAAGQRLQNLHRGKGRYEEAETVCRAAIAANPRDPGGHENLGYLAYLRRNYEGAVAEFKRVAELAPDHAPAYNYLGALYYRLERWPEATEMFEKSFSLRKSYEACSNLGTLYYMDGRFAEAARMYEWAWEYDRSDHKVIGNIAVAYLCIPGERRRAIDLFEDAIALAREKLAASPQDAPLLSQLAGYYSVDHADSAVRYAERALARGPRDSQVLYRAAMAYEQIGERAKALVLLGDAIANGQSLMEVSHERQLAELRRDASYERMVVRANETQQRQGIRTP